MKSLHIIAFDIPYPPNYGGVIVVYYHLKALAKAGVRIILHAFQYGNRQPNPQLEQWCDQVYYYPRPLKIVDQFKKRPFIVESRTSDALLKRLTQDQHPIFFEGQHTCRYIAHPKLKNRQKIVRTHNIEWQYYTNLANLENNPLKKLYFKLESWKLRQFEHEMTTHANLIISLSKSDAHYYSKQHPNTVYVPPFHPDEDILTKKGKGAYLLFHGNLSVSDNERAALYLVEEIAPKVNFPIVVAGRNPNKKLIQSVNQQMNVSLSINPSDKELNQLVQNAHIHFLWTFQKAGMKLKLLKALFNGRHCIANDLMVSETGLEQLCCICKNSTDIIKIINRLISIDFNEKSIQLRRQILEQTYSNEKNIQKTIHHIWK